MIAYLRAPNDSNGNPRRGWIVEKDGSIVFYNEGYLGQDALPLEFRKSGERGVDLSVTPSEFKRIKKLYSVKKES